MFGSSFQRLDSPASGFIPADITKLFDRSAPPCAGGTKTTHRTASGYLEYSLTRRQSNLSPLTMQLNRESTRINAEAEWRTSTVGLRLVQSSIGNSDEGSGKSPLTPISCEFEFMGGFLLNNHGSGRRNSGWRQENTKSRKSHFLRSVCSFAARSSGFTFAEALAGQSLYCR